MFNPVFRVGVPEQTDDTGVSHANAMIPFFE
jgi:hypothetical protein